jgi:dienelactone hydrolase
VKITSEQSEKNVTEQAVTFAVDGEAVPGIVWRPADDPRPRPLVLIGHGGTQHKRAPNILGLARGLVRHLGYAAVAIDAPGHGDRITDPEAAAAARRRLEGALTNGGSASGPVTWGSEQARQLRDQAARGVGEWSQVLDDLEGEGLGDGRVGYWGLSMGTAIGLPFVAAEPRVSAAVLGLFGLSERIGGEAFAAAAAGLQIPVLFIFQWDDELMTRESGLALFDTIGSTDKTLHVNPGGHVAVPPFERGAAEQFYLRTLGPVGVPVG